MKPVNVKLVYAKSSETVPYHRAVSLIRTTDGAPGQSDKPIVIYEERLPRPGPDRTALLARLAKIGAYIDVTLLD